MLPSPVHLQVVRGLCPESRRGAPGGVSGLASLASASGPRRPGWAPRPVSRPALPPPPRPY